MRRDASAFAVHRRNSGTSPTSTCGRPVQVWLLHGVFADHHLWDDVVAMVDLDIVALDAPGHGTAPRIETLPDLDGQAALLGDLVRAHSDQPVVLAGHSWGGMLALRLARRDPDLVAGLLLTNTPLLRTAGVARAGFLAQRALMAAGLPAATYGSLAARALYSKGYRRRRADVVDETRQIVDRLGGSGVVAVLDRVLLEPGDAVDLLVDLPVPVTVTAGRDDYAGAAGLRERVARAGHQVLLHPGGHMGPREAPGSVGRALQALAARAKAGDGATG